MNIDIQGTRLELVEGNIADQATDAVVTAAHVDLRGGQGTDGAIHGRAGPGLLEECRKFDGCPIGEAVITSGHALPARYVIHAVGPVWGRDKEHQVAQLVGAYQHSMRLAVDVGLRSISFPSISTGAFAYPMRIAAPIALRAIIDFLRANPRGLDLVRMVLYPRERPDAYSIYAEALRALTPVEARR